MQRWRPRVAGPLRKNRTSSSFAYGRSGGTRTHGLTAPSRTRYQLRHTPILVMLAPLGAALRELGRCPLRVMVPKEGIEPSLPYGNTILSRARLPIPPLRLICRVIILPGDGKFKEFVHFLFIFLLNFRHLNLLC